MIRKISEFLALATVFSLFVACDKNEPAGESAYTPALTVSVAIVHAAAAGGEFGFSFSVSNPVTGGTVSCSADVSWITDLDAGSDSVTFSVPENTGDYRSGSIYVFYISPFGTVTQTVTVAQSAANAPELTVQPTGVTAEIEGGVCSFSYIITNPASDGQFVCRTDAEWIGHFDYSVDGEVSFTVDENTSTDFRSGVISVEYTSDYFDLYESVTVFQDHKGLDSGTEIDFSDIVGIYVASGYAYSGTASVAYREWTLTIQEYSATEVKISGLTPQIADYYSDSEAYVAKATMNYLGQIIIPFQCTGYMSGSYYIGWMPCPYYVEGTGWYHTSSILDCTLTYDQSTGVWTSDYGIFCALFSVENSPAFFSSFIDVVNPEFTIKKVN